MKLSHPFIQLPLLFDAPALAAEIEALGESVWMPHPQGFPGNSMLPLIASGGDPRDESYAGRMAPTPHLQACPYLRKTIAALGTVAGRTRLMRLSGHAEVTRHADQGYYWADRVRVHVPIATQPTVRFECDDTHTNMGAGECWIFDTWRQHRVLNDDTRHRIHLVVDTLGSESFWQLVGAGRTHHGEPLSVPWAPRHVGPGDAVPDEVYETGALPVVMTPWELESRLRFLLGEARPEPAQAAAFEQAAGLTEALLKRWRYLWAQHGEQPEGWPAFREASKAYLARFGELVGTIQLQNELKLLGAVTSIVQRIAVSGEAAKPFYRGAAAANDPAPARPAAPPPPTRPTPPTRPAAPATSGWGVPGLGMGASLNWGMPAGSRVAAGAAAAVSAPVPVRRSAGLPRPDGSDPVFERPIFIVSSPRSGSTMLFEALAKAPGVFTIGGESHGLIEGVPELNPAAHGFESNRLEAVHARPEIMGALRQRFLDALHDRDKRAPADGRLRMLEKTPKNSLRVPFLAKVFPEALFVYLWRDPRETLASMIEAWQAQRFRTYPKLPGWDGLSWSLLLVPGWRELRGKPIADVVATQWETATRLLLDDLEALPPSQRLAVRYDAVVADPQGQMQRLAAATGLGWDRAVQDGLPLSRYTLTAPQAEKWRKHEAEITPRLAALEATMARAARFAGA